MLSIKAFLRVFYAFGFIRSKEMVASNLKLKPLFFMSVLIGILMLTACKEKEPDFPKNEPMLHSNLTKNGWACTQHIKESGNTVASTVGFYNFSQSDRASKYVSISKSTIEGIELIYKSTSQWSYEQDTLSLQSDSREFLFTEKSMETMDNVLSENDKESLLFFLSSGNFSIGEPIILTMQEKDVNSFYALGNDVEFTCIASDDAGIFFNDDIDKNHRLVHKLEQ
jgi:hypothetical protein